MNADPTITEQIAGLLKNHKAFRRQTAHIEVIPAHKAKTCQIKNLSPALENYLKQKNITPYLHQCQTTDLVRQGYHVIITTSTASGKTLAYNLPVFETLEKDKQATALYIFPTKALSNDQLRSLKELQKITGITVNPAIYDGDTSSNIKSYIRSNSRIIITNPFELHQILPWNYQWIRFFSNLKYVILDEAHHYRGVYGSNVAYLLRRLRRLLERYGSKPQFILSSATLANPLEFAYKLTGLYFKLVDTDGSPRGRKMFVFYNPFFDPDEYQTSATEEASRLMATFVAKGLKTIVFTQSRRMAELVARRGRELLQKKYPGLAERITAYRAGYLPAERRKIETALKQGDLLAVASTNALELGIDIGDLDAVIITGFPGTIMSTQQQAGRAGRRATDSIAVLVAYHDKLDQYFMKYPQEFFARPYEHAIIDTENPYIATGHILCAAAEMPINDKDREFFGKKTLENITKSLENNKLIKQTPRGLVYTGKTAPTQAVSLNSISSETYKVISQGKVLETMGRAHAFKEAHQGAVLLHQGETYVVTKFDLENRLIYAEKKNVDYYTQPLKTTSARILEQIRQRKAGNLTLYYGKLLVTEEFTGYKVKRGDQVIGYGTLELPPLEFETKGIWFTIDEKFSDEIWEKHARKKASIPSLSAANMMLTPKTDIFAGGLHGTEHALIGIMPFLVMADRWDLGGLSTINHPDTGMPTIFIYDGFPGGIGLTEKAFDLFENIAKMAYRTVNDCQCADGCPACIMSPKCGSDNRPLDKQASIMILKHISQENGKNA